MNNLWHKMNAWAMMRKQLRKEIKEAKQRVIDLERALKNLETPKLMKWINKQGERL